MMIYSEHFREEDGSNKKIRHLWQSCVLFIAINFYLLSLICRRYITQFDLITLIKALSMAKLLEYVHVHYLFAYAARDAYKTEVNKRRKF